MPETTQGWWPSHRFSFNLGLLLFGVVGLVLAWSGAEAPLPPAYRTPAELGTFPLHFRVASVVAFVTLFNVAFVVAGRAERFVPLANTRVYRLCFLAGSYALAFGWPFIPLYGVLKTLGAVP